MDRKVQQADVAHAVGTGTYSGRVIETLGSQSHLFILSFGTLATNSVASFKLQQGAASDGSDMADISGSEILKTHAGGTSLTDQIVCSELKGVVLPYIRSKTTITAAGAVLNPCICIQDGLRLAPPPTGTSVAATNSVPATL